MEILNYIYQRIFDNSTKKITAKNVRESFAKVDEKIDKISIGIQGTLKTTDPKPAADKKGLYVLADIGDYTNLVPIVPDGATSPQNTPITTLAGFQNSVYWDGTNFIQIKIAIPQASPNLRIYEDLPNGTILNPKEQVISNNVQYIVLQQAVVGTDLPTGSKFGNLNDSFANGVSLVNSENINGYISNSGVISNGDTNYKYTKIQQLKKGDKIEYSAYVTEDVPLISKWDENGVFIGYIANPAGTDVYLNKGFYIATEDIGVRFCFRQKDANGNNITTNAISFLQNLKNKTFTAGEINISEQIISNSDNNGYILSSGVIENGDTNYKYTDLKPVYEGDKIEYSAYVTEDVPLISKWDENGVFIGYIANPAGTDIYLNKGIYIVESGFSNLRFCYRQRDASSNVITTNSAIHYKSVAKSIQEINAEIKGNSTPLTLFAPSYLFTVANDTDLSKKGHNRNYSANLYLDHFFKDLTSEPDFNFGNGIIKKSFFAPIKVTDSNESNPTVQYNGGFNKLETNVSLKVFNGKAQTNNLTIKNFSALSSASKNSHPKVLCIGDSITYAELATFEEDNFTQNHGYSLITKELFMKDNIDAGSGYNLTFLGTYKKQKTFEYNGQKTATIHHEGIRGISLAHHHNGNVSQFWDGTKWSVTAFLNKYRTLDENGVRLTLGDGTGTEINAGNLNEIDVCTPTHIVFMLGANDKENFNIQYYKDLISTIKTELPNCYIGLALSDSGGTYFPSKYPMIDESMTFWDDNDAKSLHEYQYNNFKAICDFYDNATMRANKIFILPFYFVQSPYSYSYTKSDALNNSEIYPNQKMQKYGWGYHVHINAYGHMDWAYQLYGWLKYTSV